MPFIAHDPAGRVVRPATYDQETHDGRLTCPGCGGRMRHQDASENRVAFFAHLPRKTGESATRCAWDITQEHHSAVRALQHIPPQVFDLLAGIHGKEEAWLDGKHRRADVLYPGGDGRYPVAFEAQYSNIDFNTRGNGRSVEERTRDYHAKGVHVVWCFFEGRPNAEKNYRACLSRYGCAGWLSRDGISVKFGGVNALWLDLHPIDALDRRTAHRQKEEAERRAEAERRWQEEQDRRAEIARREAEHRARVEARRKAEDAEYWRIFDERQRAEHERQRIEHARRRAEYERVAEERRERERAAAERAAEAARLQLERANRPNWPAIREHCDRREWHAAYNDAGLCRGKGDSAWQAAADYIEACKAKVLAAAVAAFHASRRKDAA